MGKFLRLPLWAACIFAAEQAAEMRWPEVSEAILWTISAGCFLALVLVEVWNQWPVLWKWYQGAMPVPVIPSSKAEVPPTEEDYSQLLRTIDAAVETILNGQIPEVHLRYITTKLEDRGVEFDIPDAIHILNDSRFRDSLQLMGAYIGEGHWKHVGAVAWDPLNLKITKNNE